MAIQVTLPLAIHACAKHIHVKVLQILELKWKAFTKLQLTQYFKTAWKFIIQLLCCKRQQNNKTWILHLINVILLCLEQFSMNSPAWFNFQCRRWSYCSMKQNSARVMATFMLFLQQWHFLVEPSAGTNVIAQSSFFGVAKRGFVAAKKSIVATKQAFGATRSMPSNGNNIGK